MTEQRTAAEIRKDHEWCTRQIKKTGLAGATRLQHGWYATLGAFATTDMPRLLDAAVRLRREWLAWADLENDEAGRLFHETAWLDEPEAALSPDGENGEEGEG